MPEKRARIAFVGCGFHATCCLYPCIPFSQETDLVAVCDLDEKLAEGHARRFGGLRHYSDYKIMLDKEELDGVIIVSSPQVHVEIGLACLSRGIPILVEKPTATKLLDAASLVNAAEENNTFGMTAFMKRYATSYVIAKECTERPSFGDIKLVDVKYSCGPYEGIWDIEESGKSFLVGNAIHMCDLVQHFAGRTTEVYAKRVVVSPAQECFAATVSFDSGAIGSLSLSCAGQWENFTEGLTLSGDGELIAVDDVMTTRYYKKEAWVNSDSRSVYSNEKPWEDIPGSRSAINIYNAHSPTGSMPIRSNQSLVLWGYQAEIDNFARSCLGLEKPRATLADGYRALALSLAIWESTTAGKPVNVAS